MLGQSEERDKKDEVVISIREMVESNLRRYDGPEDKFEVLCCLNGDEWDRTASETIKRAKAISLEWITKWTEIFRENERCQER